VINAPNAVIRDNKSGNSVSVSTDAIQQNTAAKMSLHPPENVTLSKGGASA
jgi:hypothetical protein